MNAQPPWTGIGALQGEISQIKSEIRGKANGYEISSLICKLDTLEYSVREIRSMVDGFEHRMQQLEEEIRQHEYDD